MGTMASTNWQAFLADTPEECVGAAVLDHEYRLRAVTDAVAEWSGLELADLLSKSALDLLHPDDLGRAAAMIHEAFPEDERCGEGMYRMATKNGYEAFGLQIIHLPEPEGVVIVRFSEVSEVLRASELAEDLVRAVRVLSGEFSLECVIDAVSLMIERQMPNVHLAVTIFGADGAAAAFRRPGFPQKDFDANRLSHPLALPKHVAEAERKCRESQWSLHSRTGLHDEQNPERIVFAMIDDADSLIGFLEAIRPSTVAPDDGEWLVYSSAVQVIQAAVVRHRLDEALRLAADHDPLTGLLNRRGFADAVSKSEKSDGAVMVIDLDDFSWINNQLGHVVGDAALTTAANRLKTACPETAVVARLGGDEFVVWLPGVDHHTAPKIAEQVRSRMATSTYLDDQCFGVHGSIGVVVVEPCEGIEQAISRADTAMYEAKSAGGNRVVYSESSRDREPVDQH